MPVLPLRKKSENLLGSLIRDVSKDAMEQPGIIPLWFGEGSRSAPPAVVAAAKQAMDEGYQFYSASAGRTDLRVAIAEYVSKLRGIKVGPERIVVTPSGDSAIQMVMQLIVDPGDNVVFAVPLWPNGLDMVDHLNGEARRVPLKLSERGWSLDLDRLFAAVDGRTKAIFLNSPGNPTGWLATPEELKAVLEFCRKRGIWAIGDDVYERLIYDGREKAPTFLDFAEPDDAVISINSFSKTWCMTGWRLGWLVTPAPVVDTLGKIIEFNTSGATTFVQRAAIVALQQEAFVREVRGDYARARDVAFQRLSGMGRVRMARPEAAFYAFFAVDGMADSVEYCKRIVRETNVGLAPGRAFGPEGEGFIRLCFATSPERLSEAFDRLEPLLR